MNDLIERLEHAMQQSAAFASSYEFNEVHDRLLNNQILIMNALVRILRRQHSDDMATSMLTLGGLG